MPELLIKNKKITSIVLSIIPYKMSIYSINNIIFNGVCDKRIDANGFIKNGSNGD